MDNPSVTAGNVSGAAGGVGTIFSLIGNMMSAKSASQQGVNIRAANEFEAKQMEVNAGQAKAASQREAMIDARKTALLLSRGVAVAAAGGGATNDPTVVKLMGDIAAEGAYRSAIDIYQGEEKARQFDMSAAAKRNEGENAAAMGESKANAYRMAGIGGAITGGASLFSKYGQGGPKSKSPGFSDEWKDAGSSGMGSIG